MEKIEKLAPVLVQAFAAMTMATNWSVDDQAKLAELVMAQSKGLGTGEKPIQFFESLRGLKEVVCAIARKQIAQMLSYPTTINFESESEHDDQGDYYKVYDATLEIEFPEAVWKALGLSSNKHTLSFRMYDPSELYSFESSPEFDDQDLKVLWALFGCFGTDEELIERLGEDGEAEFAPVQFEIDAYDTQAVEFGDLLECLVHKDSDPFRCDPKSAELVEVV